MAVVEFHHPVLVAELMALLEPRDGGVYFDGTLGGGGHAEALLRASGPTGRLYATDRDPQALEAAASRLERFGGRFWCVRAGFDEIARVKELRDLTFDGAVLDLGVSSHQLDSPERGFSFDSDAVLDMRMGTEGPTAAELLNDLSVPELAAVFRRFGEEPFAGPVARAIVEARRHRPVTTAGELKALLRSAVPPHFTPVKVYARAFQALRIAVNDELRRLEEGLPAIFARLRVGGRLAVLSYHSLEDRIVKHTFRDLEGACVCPPGLPVCGCGWVAAGSVMTRRAVRPGPEEVTQNPRARSARLRVLRKTSHATANRAERFLPGSDHGGELPPGSVRQDEPAAGSNRSGGERSRSPK